MSRATIRGRDLGSKRLRQSCRALQSTIREVVVGVRLWQVERKGRELDVYFVSWSEPTLYVSPKHVISIFSLISSHAQLIQASPGSASFLEDSGIHRFALSVLFTCGLDSGTQPWPTKSESLDGQPGLLISRHNMNGVHACPGLPILRSSG